MNPQKCIIKTIILLAVWGCTSPFSLAARPYATDRITVEVSSDSDLYFIGETFGVIVKTTGTDGKMTGRRISLAVWELLEANGQIGERFVEAQSLTTNPNTGAVHATFKLGKPGTYVLRAIVVDSRALVADDTRVSVIAW